MAVTNPLSGLIDGILQGHAIATQLHRQAQEDQAFKTNQALHEQQATMQDIMNRQMLEQNARPVTSGTVSDQLAAAPDVPGQPEMPGGNPRIPIVRPVDKSRRVTYKGRDGQSQDYELLTPEEQQQRATERQISGNNALEEAKTKADLERQATVRQNTLKLEGGGVPASGLTAVGIPDGTPLTRAEYANARENLHKLDTKLGPGDTLFGPGSAVGQPLQPIASGGPPLPTGEFATVYLPKVAATLHNADGTPKTPAQMTKEEVEKALGDFKSANADPEVRAATLASKTSAEATRDLANTMRQVQIGQMPTKEDAARMAEHIRNHEFAPSQLSEIRGRGNGALGIMIEREMSKTDPHFNWQQADADYNYSKSPGLQNTVRLMDSAMNSIPRIQAAANKLAMGGITSINSLIKLKKANFQDVDLKRFQTDATLVGDEIGKIIQGGGTGSGVSDAKLVQAQSLLKDTDNPKLIKTALEEVNAIIGYRRQAVTRGTYLEGRQAPAETVGGAATTPSAPKNAADYLRSIGGAK